MARAKGIQRTNLYQAFEGPFTYLAQVYAFGKVVNIAKGPACAGRNDQINRVLADVLDCPQAEADSSFAIGSIFDLEVVVAEVDIWWQHLNAHVAALRDVSGTLVGIVLPRRKQGGHVFHRVVQFEVAGFHGNDAVVDRVAFVKAVMGKSFPLGKDGFSNFRADAALNSPIHKFFVVFLDFFFFLFRDRRAEVIRFTRRVSRQCHRSLHDLLLVNGQAEGILEDGFQTFVQVCDRRFAMHAVDINRNVLHWTRTEQRHHGDDVIEAVWLHLHDVSRHAVAFHLEHANGMARTNVFVSLRVIRWNISKIQMQTVAFLDKFAGFGHDGKRNQTKKVHFEQAQVAYAIHIHLGDRFDWQVFVRVGGAVQGGIFGKGLVADDNTGRVRTDIADGPFHPAGRINHFSEIR